MLSIAPDTSGKLATITAPVYVVALAVVLFLTGCNALFNVLNVEYGGKNTLFLFDPSERDGDLVKSAISFPPFEAISKSDRDEAPAYYADIPYQGIDGVPKGDTTALDLPPFMILLVLLIKRAFLWWGVDPVVYCYYLFALACIISIVLQFRSSYWGAGFAFVTLGLSFPFQMVLCRGNYGALITGVCLIFFLSEVVSGKHAYVAGLLLSVAINCHPNIILLTPLLLVFGLRTAVLAAILCGVCTATLLLASYLLAEYCYPGYNFAVFQYALHTYYRQYVIEGCGFDSNNSAYGAVWPLVHAIPMWPALSAKLLGALELNIFAVVAVSILGFAFLYLRARIDRYEFAYAISALYILGSSVIGSYHLFFLFIFILIFARRSFELTASRTHYVILAITVLVLAPKYYGHIHPFHASIQVFLNPLLLILGLIMLVWWRTDLRRARIVRSSPET